MDHYDIAIVGGGPAGLSAAYTAAKTGVKVPKSGKCRAVT